MRRFDEVEVIDETVPAYRKVGMLVGFAPTGKLIVELPSSRRTALVRERIAAIDPNLGDTTLGNSPYVPEGPGISWIDARAVPPLAEDVTFVSPLLTAEATGKSINERILTAAREVSEIRVFSRPWPVTASFRRCMYELLKDSPGPESWQGPDPEGPLPIR